jgi:hypothetical protein
MVLLTCVTLLGISAPAGAQGRGQRLNAGASGQGREALMQQVIEQFTNRYERMAALTPEQSEKFRAALMRNMQTRRDLQQHERRVLQALEMQMRPGVAANADSVTKLIDALLAARQATVDQSKAEHREYATFLNPVQRAQFTIQWEQLMNRVAEVSRPRSLRPQPPDSQPGR